MRRRQYLLALGTGALVGCSQPDGESESMNTTTTENTDTGTVPTESTGESTTEKPPEQANTIKAKVDLHAHLYRGGGQPMADRYAELGFDVLVGTDHSYDGQEYMGRRYDGSPTGDEVMDYQDLEFPGPILDGIELSEGPHINLIRSENEEIKQINHPDDFDNRERRIRELQAETGADLVEVNHRSARANDRFLEYPTPSDVIRDFEDLHPMATSDAHAVDEIVPQYVVVEVPELTGDEVIRALKDGRYSIGGVW